MSKLANLRATKTKFEVGGIELDLEPMTVEELAELAELQSKGMKEAFKFLVFSSLKKADPEATEDDINHLNQDAFNKLITKLLEINGLKKKEIEKTESPQSES